MHSSYVFCLKTTFISGIFVKKKLNIDSKPLLNICFKTDFWDIYFLCRSRETKFICTLTWTWEVCDYVDFVLKFVNCSECWRWFDMSVFGYVTAFVLYHFCHISNNLISCKLWNIHIYNVKSFTHVHRHWKCI